MRLLPILLGFILTVSLPATQSTFSTISDVVGTVVPSLFAIPISEIIFILGVKSVKLAIAAKLMGLMADWWDTDQRVAIQQVLKYKTPLNLPYPWLKHGYKTLPIGLPANFGYSMTHSVGNPYIGSMEQFAATKGYFDNHQESPIFYNSGSYGGLQQERTNEDNRDKQLWNYSDLNRPFWNKQGSPQSAGYNQGNPQSAGYNQENDQLAGYSRNNFPSYFAGYSQDNSQSNSDRYFQDNSQSTFDGYSQDNLLSNFSGYSQGNSQSNFAGYSQDSLQLNSDGYSQANFLLDGYNQLGQQTTYHQRDSAQSNNDNMDSQTENKEPSPVFSSSGTKSSRQKRSFNSQIDRIFSIIKEVDNNNCIARMVCEIGLNNRQFEEYGDRMYKFFNDLSLSRMELDGPASNYLTAFKEGTKKNHDSCITMFETCDLTVPQLSDLLRLLPINI